LHVVLLDFFKGKKGVLYYFTVFRILQKIIEWVLNFLFLFLNRCNAFSASLGCNNLKRNIVYLLEKLNQQKNNWVPLPICTAIGVKVGAINPFVLGKLKVGQYSSIFLTPTMIYQL
jgi:hypothetical protein